MPKLRSWHPYLIAGTGFLLAAALFTWAVDVTPETYKQLRGSLFTGFFTVAGFLLSAKKLVILNMKKEVYEKEQYLLKLHQEHWSAVENHVKQSKTPRARCGPPPKVYGPLSQIGSLLTTNIILSLVTSFSQITVGLTGASVAIVFCMSSALGTAFLLACSVYLMWENFHLLYKMWEGQAQIVLDKHWDSSMDAFHASLPAVAPGELPIQSSIAAGNQPSKSDDAPPTGSGQTRI